MTPTAFYVSLTAALDRRIRVLRWTMRQCDDASGLQDGFTAKLLNAASPGGRQVRWETLQLLVDALYPSGVKVVLQALDGNMQALASIEVPAATPPRKAMYVPTTEKAREMAELRAKSQTPERRRIIAIRASVKRWDKVRAERQNVAKPKEQM